MQVITHLPQDWFNIIKIMVVLMKFFRISNQDLFDRFYEKNLFEKSFIQLQPIAPRLSNRLCCQFFQPCSFSSILFDAKTTIKFFLCHYKIRSYIIIRVFKCNFLITSREFELELNWFELKLKIIENPISILLKNTNELA